MMMQHIDRSRSTGGGMAASFVIHGGLLLLLVLVAGRQAAIIDRGSELTEIAYIEARYGEDVAAKVKLKEKPKAAARNESRETAGDKPQARPEPPGRGINTDSVQKKPIEPAVAKAKVVEAKVAEVKVAAPVVASAPQPKTLAQAQPLKEQKPAPAKRRIIDQASLSGSLSGSLTGVKVQEAAALKSQERKSTQEAFAPRSSGLKSKSGTVALGQDVVAGAATSGTAAKVAEAEPALAAGGGLKSAGGSILPAQGANLVPSGSGARTGKAQAVVDVDGPGGAGSLPKSGRKTILDYGSGSGGRGSGSLSGRARLAEPAAATQIVKDTAPAAKADQGVTEAKLEGKGVNMTITGQIQGRKILHSQAPEYSAAARKNGWEGVVAVHFTVKADGKVKDNMFFDQTSVHRDLNQAAMRAIKQFVFAPLSGDQAAVEQWGVITIVFRLK